MPAVYNLTTCARVRLVFGAEMDIFYIGDDWLFAVPPIQP